MKFSILTLILIAFATTLLGDGGTTSGSTFRLVNMAAMAQDACTKAGKWLTPEGCKGKKSTQQPKKLRAYIAQPNDRQNIYNAVLFGETCRVRPGGCIRPKFPPTKPTGPKTKMAYSRQDQIAPSRKPGGGKWMTANAATFGDQCRYKDGGCIRRPFPPTKPKLPKTRLAFYDTEQMRPAESKAVYTYGIRKRRRITAFQTVLNLLGTPEKAYGGCTTREMNKHLSRHLLRPRSSDAINLYGGYQLPPVVRKEKPPGPGNSRKRSVCHRCTGGR